jgi:hypothetical protein
MKRLTLILLIPLISLIQGCLPPIMYDDNTCGNGNATARFSVNGVEYGYITAGYSIVYGVNSDLMSLYMSGGFEAYKDVEVGDVVYLEVTTSSDPADIAIDIYIDYSRIYTKHLYVYTYSTDYISLLMTD